MIQEESEPWGPISFTVLSSGDIAVLDSGNQRILVLDREGNQLRGIRYEEVGLVSPMDLVEWEDQLAVVESNTSPQTVVVIDLQTNKKTGIVPLPSALAEHRPKFILGDGEKLQLVEGGSIAHVVADKSGDLPVSAIAQDRNDLDIKGFGTVWSSPGVPKEGIAPTLARTQQVGTTQDVAVSLSGVPATWVEPIGKSRPGGLLLYTSYIVEGRGALTTRFYVEERSSETLQSKAYAAVPVEEFQVFPAKFIAVSSTGEIWCMVPKKDRVSFEQLTPAPGVPAL